MLTVVTGAAGFVGQALVRLMAERTYPGRVRLVDRERPQAPQGYEAIAADVAERGTLLDAIAGADRVLHLAALPGGASERDPAASRKINLDAALNLIEGVRSGGGRLVLASSIAVFGAPHAEQVDDSTPPGPSMTYGAHKLMSEIALADAVRRGDVQGIALRLPAIVARPMGAEALKSAFISDIFWAVRAGHEYELPVSPGATMWIMSARCCASNLLHAASLDLPLGTPAALTLPALRVTMADLVEAIARAAGGGAGRISYRPDPGLEPQFGRQPPLRTPLADRLGFRHDGDLDRLVRQAFEDLPSELPA